MAPDLVLQPHHERFEKIFKTVDTTESRKDRCDVGASADRGEQYSIEL